MHIVVEIPDLTPRQLRELADLEGDRSAELVVRGHISRVADGLDTAKVALRATQAKVVGLDSGRTLLNLAPPRGTERAGSGWLGRSMDTATSMTQGMWEARFGNENDEPRSRFDEALATPGFLSDRDTFGGR